jgi:phage-related protein
MAINLPIISKYDNKGVKDAEGAIGGLGRQLKGLGTVLAAAFSFAAVGQFAKDSIVAAEAVREANNRLGAVAKSMGIFGTETDAVTQRLVDYAEANELTLGTDAEVIKQTQAKLLTFKGLADTADDTGSSFDRATKAAIDLAATGFGSAESNATALGKALNDPVKGITALARSGVTFTDQEKEKIKSLKESGDLLGAQNIILGAIETQVGGTAEATATSSEKMKLGFDNIKEAVGERLLPLFDTFANFFVTTLVPAVQSALEKFDEFRAMVSGIFDGAGGGVDGLMALLTSFTTTVTNWIEGDGLQTLLTNFLALRTAIINALIETLPGIIAQVVNALVAALPAIVDALLGMIPTLLETAQLVFEALVEAALTIVPQLLNAIIGMLPQIVTTLMDMLPTLITTALDLFLGLIDGLLLAIPELLIAIIDTLPTIVQALADMLPGLVTGAIDLFLGLIDGLLVVIPKLITSLTDDVLPSLIKTLVDLIPVLIPAAINLFLALVQGLAKATPLIIKALVELVPLLVRSLLSVSGQLVSAGFQLLMGLIKGMVDNAPRLIGETVKNLANLVTDGFKALLGIKSPSKVFMGFGKNIAQGLVGGLVGSERLVENAVDDLAAVALGAGGTIALGLPAVAEAGSVASGATGLSESNAISIMPSSGGNAPSANTYNINVNAGMGTDGTNVGRQIVDEILRFERASGRVFVRA